MKDVVVVGAGIGGIVFLKYAKAAGLDALALEKGTSVGGVWRDVPAWQDIQSTKEDWALNGLLPKSEYQADIHQNIQDWVSKYELQDMIRLEHEVQRVRYENERWIVQTSQGDFESKYLAVASGAHNLPVIPSLKKDSSAVKEFHSSQFDDPTLLKGKKVTVVGAGASAFDLLDLAIENEANEIRWVYRSQKWFFPTSGRKYEKTDLRTLARSIMLGASQEKLSSFMNEILQKKYAYFGLDDIRPQKPFNFDYDQIVPGRCRMIREFKSLKRHLGEIESIAGNRVTVKPIDQPKLSTRDAELGGSFETDVLLWGTGYAVDLKYLGLPKIDQAKNIVELRKRCGLLFKSLDYPNLFFVGVTILDGNSSTPWSYSVISRSIVSHMTGKTRFPDEPRAKLPVHWNSLHMMAQHDRHNYPWWWKIKALWQAMDYFRNRKKIVSID